jgi:hypothetical protein
MFEKSYGYIGKEVVVVQEGPTFVRGHHQLVNVEKCKTTLLISHVHPYSCPTIDYICDLREVSS